MARSAIDIDHVHSGLHRFSQRVIEPCQDLLMLGLSMLLFGLMVRTGARLFGELFEPVLNFRVVISEVLFLLVMVEVLRLVIVYIQEHRVAVDFMLELGIVVTLREIMLPGVVELNWKEVVALSFFLVALGVMLRFGDLRMSGKTTLEHSTKSSGVATGTLPRITGHDF